MNRIEIIGRRVRLRDWTDHVFGAFPGIVRLGLGTCSGNVRMMGLAQKLGYQQEACFRKARIVRGEYYDSVGYGILREEWRARYPNGFAVDALGVDITGQTRDQGRRRQS